MSTTNDAKPKFSVYKNPTFSAALTEKSLRPSISVLVVLFSISCVSIFALLAIVSRESGIVELLGEIKISYSFANWVARSLEVLIGLFFVATLTALLRAFLWRNTKPAFVISYSKNGVSEKGTNLSERQLGLLGFKLKEDDIVSIARFSKRPPKTKAVPFVSEPLVPIRKKSHGYSPSRVSGFGLNDQKNSTGVKVGLLSSPISPSTPYNTASPSTPWLKSTSGGKRIQSEEMLEQFLADVDEKIVDSAVKAATPPATIFGFGFTSPGSVTNSTTTSSGATRSTPLRSVRMSPGSHHKYGTPPKKGETDSPSPMSMEKMIQGYNVLGVYPQIEQWRDRLRQWFSSALLKPLIEKIETSHILVMQAVAAIGVSITVSQIGTDTLVSPTTVNVSPIDGSKEWQPTFTLDEDGHLHQLRAALVQTRDRSVPQAPSLFGGQSQQPNQIAPFIQICIDAITEYQGLNALMKGELVKGLLPQSTVRAEYNVKRVKELAEGTCVKNYEYEGSDEKFNNKWSVELPSDSHLLVYLFCAFLDHPKWMLHVNPTSYSNNQSIQSSKNPLFLGFLPPKDRFPEKYVAVISSIPSVIHPGACILVIGKQSPPVFNLYWDKKLQFSLQGRTALWDSILLLCHNIKTNFGGVIRGLHLGSSAFNLLPIFEAKETDC